jgi:hypothetical protein
MDDPYPHDTGGGRRCSFCGRSEEEASQMVQGPDVYMCASCVQDAAGMVGVAPDGGETPDPGSEDPGLTKADWRAAYGILAHTAAPLRDLIQEAYLYGRELPSLAEDVKFFRTAADIDGLSEAMAEARALQVRSILEANYRQN